ncbi:MAG: hypothetical protein WBI40_11500 [Methylococcaceae bacterium]
MIKPNFEQLKKEMKERPGVSSRFHGVYMHPRPDFYKYYWSIFWQGSPCDGGEFLSREHWLSTKKAMDFIKELESKGEHCWIYNRKLRRLDPNNPFNMNSKWWKDSEWAVSFDEDTDEIYKGHK